MLIIGGVLFVRWLLNPLLGLGLPDGMRTELMEELRATQGLRGIVLSGYGMEKDLRRSLDAGFVAHLNTPVDVNELRCAI